MRHTFKDTISNAEALLVLNAVSDKREAYNGKKTFTWSVSIAEELENRQFSLECLGHVMKVLTIDFLSHGDIYTKIHKATNNKLLN